MADKIYFHVNKKPSNLPPDSTDFEFMKEGQSIPIGKKENPFWLRWKNDIPFKFNGSESFPEAASFKEFLEILKEGKYNKYSNTPELLWNPLMFYFNCLSELILESIRLNEFNTLPSRQKCL